MKYVDFVKHYEAKQDEAGEIVKLFVDYFDETTDKDSVEIGIQFFIEKTKILSKKNILSQEEWLLLFELVRATLMKKIILSGELPSSYWCQLYSVLSVHNVAFSKDDTVLFFREQFYTIFTSLPAEQNEKYIYNTLIFLLDLLSLRTNDALKFFLERSICIDASCYVEFQEANFLKDFLKQSSIEMSMIVSVVSKIVEPQYFYALTKGQQRSLVTWLMNVVWTIPSYFNNRGWLDLYTPLKELIHQAILKNDIATQMYLHFFLYHISGNNYQTQAEWRIFNEEIEKPASAMYENFSYHSQLKSCKSVKPQEGKLKIAFVRDRMVDNSPFRLEYSLLKFLTTNEEFAKRYQVYYVSMSYIDKAVDDEALMQSVRDLGVIVISPGDQAHEKIGFYDHLEKALLIRNTLIEIGIDIMVGAVNGYDIMNFLFSTRTAPTQIYWSHGNAVYDVRGIDKRITHCALNEYNEHTFEFFTPPIDKERYLAPYVHPDAIQEERLKYPSQCFILGFIGRLIKIDSDEYLSTIARIMKKNLNTIYIAAGIGDKQTLRKKVEKLGISDRFYTPGFVDAHLYGYIIQLFCDAWPHSAGASRDEFMSKGQGVVIFPDFSRSLSVDRIGLIMEKVYGDQSTLHQVFPQSIHDYVENSSTLINNHVAFKGFAHKQMLDIAYICSIPNSAQIKKCLENE